jgi:hypothetical protein
MKRTILLLSVVIGLVTSCTYDIRSSSPSEESGVGPTAEPVKKVLSTFQQIEGTDYLMAQISANPEARESSGNPLDWIRSGYSYSGFTTHNFVFFDLETETVHRLLPNNDNAILQTTGFPTPQYDPSQPDEPNPPIEWWLYTIVKGDTDGNGRMDYDDKLTLGVSDVGGNGYADLIADVDGVLGQIYQDNILFVIYNANEKNHIAKINLPAREVVTTIEMDLGDDMK